MLHTAASRPCAATVSIRVRRWLFIMAALATWSVAAGAPPAWGESAGVRRVKGLEAEEPESQTNGMPELLLPAGDRFVYVARSGGGPAPRRLLLWASDGSAAGTEAVRELCVDCGLVAAASTGRVAFLAVCETGGCYSGESRLWRSDGSPSGTYPLTLPLRVAVRALVVAGDFAYLLACGSQCSVTGSDGTVEGTRPLVIPELGAYTASLTAWNNKAYLLSEGPSIRGTTLWRLSARNGRAKRVRDFPYNLCLAAAPSIDRLLLIHNSSDLWASDGTSVGTTLLHHFEDIGYSLDGCGIADRGGRAWFVASANATSEQLWSTDGTPAGTRRATKIGPAAPDGRQLAKVGSRLLFPALDQGARRLWTTDGNWRSASPITGCRGGCPEVVAAQPFAPLGERMAFIGRRPGEPVAMWITDGTGPGTVKVHDVPTAEYLLPWVTAREGRWYLSTSTEPEGEYGPPRNALWASDGTPGGTVELATTEEVDEASKLESMLLAFGGRAYFPGCAGGDCGLLATDGRAAHAVRTVTFEAGSVLAGGGDRLVAPVGSHVLLAGESSFWLADATAAVKLPRSATGPFDAYDWWSVEATASGDRTFVLSRFTASTFHFGDSFWSTDGTAAGTTLLEGPFPATVRTMAPWRDGRVLFTSVRYISTGEPPSWHSVPSLGTSDGTVAGTVRFVDLPTGLYPGALITHDAVALFVLSPNYSLDRDVRLWISDGTAAGTRALTSAFATLGAPVVLGERAYALASRADGEPILLVVDLASQAVSEVALAPLGIARAAVLTTVAGRLWLAARAAGDAEWSLWVSDGTPAATQRLPAVLTFPPRGITVWPLVTALDDVVYFGATDGVHGRELWRSDGTVAGTALVADLAPGFAAGAPRSNLLVWDGRLYFAADDGMHGPELWSSDGTAAGTRLEIDLAAGATGSSLTDLTLAGDRLFFVADDGVSGWQLWVMDQP